MEPAVERELLLPATPEEVWESLSEPAWLGEDAQIDLRPSGDVRAGGRTGFVEWADPPAGVAFWWSEDGGEATRVEIALEPEHDGTRMTVTESRPLAVLDAVGADLHLDLGVPRPGTPELLAR
jgi:uncharacterized protein YndB with AHSA1/START domain